MADSLPICRAGRLKLGHVLQGTRRPAASRATESAPPSACRARGRMLHPGRVEGRSPTSLVVLSQLQVVALGCIPTATPNAGPTSPSTSEGHGGRGRRTGEESPGQSHSPHNAAASRILQIMGWYWGLVGARTRRSRDSPPRATGRFPEVLSTRRRPRSSETRG